MHIYNNTHFRPVITRHYIDINIAEAILTIKIKYYFHITYTPPYLKELEQLRKPMFVRTCS